MRVLSPVCRNGHKMAGANLLWHTRYDEAGNKTMVRECRACANRRYRNKRRAERRNRRLEKEAIEAMKKVA